MNALEIARQAVEEKGAMQKPSELAALLEIAQKRNPDSVWEIGTATGGTLWAVASVLGPGHTYVSIDLVGGPFGISDSPTPDELAQLIDDVAWPCQIEIIRGDSRTIDLPESSPPKLLLIDGDHTYEGVRHDFNRFWPHVEKGGLIALHDIVEHSMVAQQAGVSVHRFWAELKQAERTTEIVDHDALRPGTGRWGGAWGGWGLVYR